MTSSLPDLSEYRSSEGATQFSSHSISYCFLVRFFAAGFTVNVAVLVIFFVENLYELKTAFLGSIKQATELALSLLSKPKLVYEASRNT